MPDDSIPCGCSFEGELHLAHSCLGFWCCLSFSCPHCPKADAAAATPLLCSPSPVYASRQRVLISWPGSCPMRLSGHSSDPVVVHKPDSPAHNKSQPSLLPGSGRKGTGRRGPGAEGYLGAARLGPGQATGVANAELCGVPGCRFRLCHMDAAGTAGMAPA